MIASPSRQEDMAFRLTMLDHMEWFIHRHLQTGSKTALESAKMIGQVCADLKKRIEGHDYKTDDRWR